MSYAETLPAVSLQLERAHHGLDGTLEFRACASAGAVRPAAGSKRIARRLSGIPSRGRDAGAPPELDEPRRQVRNRRRKLDADALGAIAGTWLGARRCRLGRMHDAPDRGRSQRRHAAAAGAGEGRPTAMPDLARRGREPSGSSRGRSLRTRRSSWRSHPSTSGATTPRARSTAKRAVALDPESASPCSIWRWRFRPRVIRTKRHGIRACAGARSGQPESAPQPRRDLTRRVARRIRPSICSSAVAAAPRFAQAQIALGGLALSR